MGRKQKTLSMVVLLIVFFGGCTVPAISTLPKSTHMQISDWGTSKNGDSIEEQLPSQPILIQPQLDFTVQSRMNRELELTYEVYPAAMMLKNILTQADETAFVNVKEVSGFLEISGNFLFYTNDSIVGPGHIWLETKAGGTEEVVRFSRPVMAVDILSNTRQFVIIMANLVHSEGWQGNAYTIHFEENALEPFSAFPVFHNPSVQDTLYQGNWYRQQANLAEGELPSLYLVAGDGSLKGLEKNGTGFAFANGNIYFLDKTMRNLRSIDVNIDDAQNIYTFSSPIQGNFVVNQNRILYYQDGKAYIAPLNGLANSQELPAEFSGVRHAMEPDIIWGYSKDTSCVYIWPFSGPVAEYPLPMDIGMPKTLHHNSVYFTLWNSPGEPFVNGKVNLANLEVYQFLS